MRHEYGVYIKTDENNRVTAINSDVFLTALEGWQKIAEGNDDKHRHAQGNYLDKPIMDERGVYRYKLDGGKVVERTTEEMDADFALRPAPEPTTEELLLETAGDHEYRLCLMELGINESDLQET